MARRSPRPRARRVAASTAAGVHCLVLNHFVPVCFDKSALLAEVLRDYGGPVMLGEDLLKLEIDTGQISYAGLVLGLAAASPEVELRLPKPHE